jgi:alpha-ribazole phosphatase/probable phosphoglycerate mutase
MKIWITRHEQTRLNRLHLMQGRTDEPLNETGTAQARAARRQIGDIRFDAVYASPLVRAVRTAAIIGGVDISEVKIDERLIEADFGRYEQKKYWCLGPAMSLYWALPEIFPAPKTVESTASLRERSTSFLRELEQKGYENVLISCHGGIMRALSGYLMDRKNGLYWRPKPHNCEIRVFEAENGKHRLLKIYPSPKKEQL